MKSRYENRAMVTGPSPREMLSDMPNDRVLTKRQAVEAVKHDLGRGTRAQRRAMAAETRKRLKK